MSALFTNSLPARPLSYPAGASAWDPYRFRVVGSESPNWRSRLIGCFPAVAEFFGPQSLVISAYPATLGLTGFCPSVETFLHPATFFSALQLAALEDRPVLLAAQPLIGADLLYRAIQEHLPLPRKILWGTGGYETPVSLEHFVRSRLRDCGVEIRCLYSYGMAEVGHSLLCAMERTSSGSPAYRQIADDIQVQTDESSQLVIVDRNGRPFPTGDFAEQHDGSWSIRSSPHRLDPRVKAMLESWGDREWSRRTGYLSASDRRVKFQLRERVRKQEANELCYHLFWHRFGGAITMKPKWNWQHK